MYKGRVEPVFSDHDPRSGLMIPPPRFYPHIGSTLMDVCLRSFSSSSVVLISTPAVPNTDYFLQSKLIHVTGDINSFHARHPPPITLVVSIGSLSCYMLADLFPRGSSSSNNNELPRLAPAMDTDYLKDCFPPDPNLITLLPPLSPLD